MATIQATDLRGKVEPRIVGPEFDFGPLDSVAANAVLLTRENLRKVGAYPPRSEYDWDCLLFIYQTIAGVETIVDLSSMTITGTYYDHVSQVANVLTVANGGATGDVTLSFAVADAPTAGMYRFSVKAVDTDTFELCSGWLEIDPAIPT